MGKSLYGEIYCSLRSEITSEAIPVGSFLPSELSLIKKFNCSRMTVRKAISLLANEVLFNQSKAEALKSSVRRKMDSTKKAPSPFAASRHSQSPPVLLALTPILK